MKHSVRIFSVRRCLDGLSSSQDAFFTGARVSHYIWSAVGRAGGRTDRNSIGQFHVQHQEPFRRDCLLGLRYWGEWLLPERLHRRPHAIRYENHGHVSQHRHQFAYAVDPLQLLCPVLHAEHGINSPAGRSDWLRARGTVVILSEIRPQERVRRHSDAYRRSVLSLLVWRQYRIQGGLIAVCSCWYSCQCVWFVATRSPPTMVNRWAESPNLDQLCIRNYSASHSRWIWMWKWRRFCWAHPFWLWVSMSAYCAYQCQFCNNFCWYSRMWRSSINGYPQDTRRNPIRPIYEPCSSALRGENIII